MKLEEAIEYAETRAKDLDFQGFDREAQALKLLIEAGKRLNLWRECGDEVDISPLPGETED